MDTMAPFALCGGPRQKRIEAPERGLDRASSKQGVQARARTDRSRDGKPLERKHAGQANREACGFWIFLVFRVAFFRSTRVYRFENVRDGNRKKTGVLGREGIDKAWALIKLGTFG